jgi:hypothetical protein
MTEAEALGIMVLHKQGDPPSAWAQHRTHKGMATLPFAQPAVRFQAANNSTLTCRPARTASVTSMSKLNCCHLPRTRSLTRDWLMPSSRAAAT